MPFRLGSEHLPPDAIESASSELTARTTYGQGIVDEAMQWNRDRESSSIDSSSDSGAGTSSDNASKSSSRGLDPSTLYFKKEDVVMLVDGRLPAVQVGLVAERRFLRYQAVYALHLRAVL